jgi:predicted lipid-binding transport protein (Tim44 family)
MFRPRWVTAFIAIAAVFVLMTADAHARAGGGFSGGSRGMRTFSAPPSTSTAPTAAPIQNSMTQPGGVASIGQAGARPGLFGGRGLFGGGLFGGLAAGFLGAGLFGLLFGHGFFGGMAGFASIIGLLLQVVLVVIVARLIFAWWQRRNMSAPAYTAARPGWKCEMTMRSIAFGSIPAARRSARNTPADGAIWPPVPVSIRTSFAPVLTISVVKGVASLSAGMNASASALSTSANGTLPMNLSVIGRYQMPS